MAVPSRCVTGFLNIAFSEAYVDVLKGNRVIETSNCKSLWREPHYLFCNVFGLQIEPRTALDPKLAPYAKSVARARDVLSKDLPLKNPDTYLTRILDQVTLLQSN